MNNFSSESSQRSEASFRSSHAANFDSLRERLVKSHAKAKKPVPLGRKFFLIQDSLYLIGHQSAIPMLKMIITISYTTSTLRKKHLWQLVHPRSRFNSHLSYISNPVCFVFDSFL